MVYPVQNAGNVLRTNTDLKLSFRIPPGIKASSVEKIIKQKLEDNPPFGSQVTFSLDSSADGFHAPPLEGKLLQSLHDASMHITGLPPLATWVGGTIPFMAMIQENIQMPNSFALVLVGQVTMLMDQMKTPYSVLKKTNRCSFCNYRCNIKLILYFLMQEGY